MSESKQEITLYENSPLQAIIEGILLKIQELTNKYPTQEVEDEDTLFARAILKQVTNLLEVFKKDCIPLLDNKRTLSVSVTDGHQLVKLGKRLSKSITLLKKTLATHPVEGQPSSNNTRHPMLVDLFIKIQELLSTAPIFIKHLAPFLNHSIFDSWVVKKIFSLAANIQINEVLENKPEDTESFEKTQDPQLSPQSETDFYISYTKGADTKTFSAGYFKFKQELIENITSTLLSSSQVEYAYTNYVPDTVLTHFFNQVQQRITNYPRITGETELKSASEPTALGDLVSLLRKITLNAAYLSHVFSAYSGHIFKYAYTQDEFTKFFSEEFPDTSLEQFLFTLNAPSQKHIPLQIALLNYKFKQIVEDILRNYQKSIQDRHQAESEESQKELTPALERWNLHHTATCEGFNTEVAKLENQEFKAEDQETITANEATLSEIKKLQGQIKTYLDKTSAELNPYVHQLKSAGFNQEELNGPFVDLISRLSTCSHNLTNKNQEITTLLAVKKCDTQTLKQQRERILRQTLELKTGYEQQKTAIQIEQAELRKAFQATKTRILEETKEAISQTRNVIAPPTHTDSAHPAVSEEKITARALFAYLESEEKKLGDEIEAVQSGKGNSSLGLCYKFQIELSLIDLNEVKDQDSFPKDSIGKSFNNYGYFLSIITPFCTENAEYLNEECITKPGIFRKAFSNEKTKIGFDKSCQAIKNALKNIPIAKIKLNDNHRETKEKLATLKNQLAEQQKLSKKSDQKLDDKLKLLQAQETQATRPLQLSADFLGTTINLFELLNTLKSAIESTDEHSTDWKILIDVHKKLLSAFELFKQLEHYQHKDFSNTVKQIQDQIDILHGSFEKALHVRFCKDIQDSLDPLSFLLILSHSELRNIEKKSDRIFRAGINTYVEETNRYSTEAQTQIQRIKQAIEDSPYRTYLAKLKIPELEVQEDIRALNEKVLERSARLLVQIQDGLAGITFSEEGIQSRENELFLAELEQQLTQLSPLTRLAAGTKTTNSALITQVSDLIERNRLALESKKAGTALARGRFLGRTALCERLKQGINSYDPKTCNRLEHWQVIYKTSLTPESICQSLIAALDLYNQNGAHEPVIELIRNSLPHCQNIHLKSLLNHIAISLIDCDDAKPDYYNSEPILYTHGAALEKLRINLGANGIYCNCMKNLYSKIEEMKQFAQDLPDDQAVEKGELEQLATNLERDVDRFIIQNHKLQLKNCGPLRERLSFRLHSKDDTMSKHFREWTRWIFNILFSPFLLIQIPYSLGRTGKITFFLAESDKEKQIHSLEKEINKMLPLTTKL